MFVLAVVLGLSASPAWADVRIMCVGDSITAGYTDNPRWNVPFEFGYRSGLYTRLNQAGYSFQFVGASSEPWDGRFGLPTNTPSLDLRPLGQDHHRGYGGWGTTNILGNIGQWLVDDNPDMVLLMVGINDISPFGIGLAKAKIAISNIVQTIVATKPDADLIVAQITPTVSYSQDIVSYNTYIRETLVPFFRSQGKQVSTVDQYTNLLANGSIDPALFSNALNHPNAVAYDRIAQTWYDAIRTVRPASSGIDPPAFLPGGGFAVDPEAGASFRFDAMSGIQYRIVYTDNLLSEDAWAPVTPPADGWIVALSNGPMAVIDSSAAGVICRFYRIQAR